MSEYWCWGCVECEGLTPPVVHDGKVLTSFPIPDLTEAEVKAFMEALDE